MSDEINSPTMLILARIPEQIAGGSPAKICAPLSSAIYIVNSPMEGFTAEPSLMVGI
jgi:hypothetical protein